MAHSISICSDSVSALSSSKAGSTKNHQDLVYEILVTNSRFANQGKDVVFMWTPAHTGILGNERVDKLAKEAVKKRNVEMTHCQSRRGKYPKQWQQYFDNAGKRRLTCNTK